MFLCIENVSGKILYDIYMFVWKLGLKFIYYLRSESFSIDEKSVLD